LGSGGCAWRWRRSGLKESRLIQDGDEAGDGGDDPRGSRPEAWERLGMPPPARGIRNTGEQAMLAEPAQACGVYIGLFGPA